ncbi:MAG TPA: MBL fold metallo-hydrolase [Candidatus Binatia bacterium]|jgi:flavorubredoxin|nr:MBL fold metallo-hydrolase [Candidatus Binatia bacterium]
MQSTVTEIAPEIYRISTFHPEFGIQFNQFLIKDDEPFLMHTGLKKMFAMTYEAVASVFDPAKLRWIGFSHFESDECGALNEWLTLAPSAQAVCSVVGAVVMVNDFADRPARPLADGEVLHTGRHRLQFLSTPHVPHCWDAGLFFEEVDRTLLCSDLFFHPGNPEPLTESDVLARARESIVQNLSGPLAKDMPYTPYTDATLRRLAALKPRTLALMHGSTFQGDGAGAVLGLAEVLRKNLGERRTS